MARFGLYVGAQMPLEQLSELAQHAERHGFDGWFCTEHHQQRGINPSPLVTLAALAGRTQRLKLGTAVLLPPLYHPVRLATDAAVLDQLSGGRLILGAGLGYQGVDFDAFGIPIRQRVSLLEEAIAITRLAWAGEPFSFEGKRYHLQDVTVVPTPAQAPRPPIWLAGWTEPGVRRAARIGDAWLTDPIVSLSATKLLRDAYLDEAARHGTRPEVVLMRPLGIAASRERAMELYAESNVATYRYYWRNGALNADLEPWLREITGESQLTWENLGPERVILGDPADCIEQIRSWFDATGSDYMIFSISPRGGAGSWAETKAAIELFGREVIPAFA
ncbi:MAG: LLM class flavin-dependent oxidoreductase [Dehalococcoidia bacterium]|nr:LLM class flavin-dependent oxidoreductase [Dehalococcoidia bacterium]